MSEEPFQTRREGEEPPRRREYGERRERGSLFWPILLIGIGVIWLLSNIGVLTDLNIGILLRLWPLVLVVIGLDLLFGRRWPALSVLIGLATVVLVIALLLYGPQLGIAADRPATFFGFPIVTGIDESDIRTERFTELLRDAQSAEVVLDLHPGRTTIRSLDDSDALIDAELTYVGEIDFRASGERTKTVRLAQRDAIRFGPLFTDGSRLLWDIGLTPEIPLDLSIDAGSGPTDADLSRLQLQSLDLNGGSGSLDVTLPEGATDYRAYLDGGSGRINLTVPEGAALSDLAIDAGSGALDVAIEAGARLEARIEAGSGRLTVDVPEQTGVRVRVTDGGSGTFRVPSDYRRVEGGDDDTGTWESPNYTSATQRIELQFDLGSGPVQVR
jgi:hypothetical protein